MTMVDPPQNLPPTEAERFGVITSRMPGGSWGGETRFALDGPYEGPAPEPVVPFDEVWHGDDGTVPRPSAKRVQWVGAAFPVNGAALDFWYPVTVTD